MAHSAVRCPPTGKQLAGNPTVKKTINEAFKRADQFRNECSYWVEHGLLVQLHMQGVLLRMESASDKQSPN